MCKWTRVANIAETWMETNVYPFILTSSSVGRRPTNEWLNLTWGSLKIRKRNTLHRPTRKSHALRDPPTGKWLKFTKISCTSKQVLESSGLKDSYTSYSCRSSHINKRPNKEWKSSPLQNRGPLYTNLQSMQCRTSHSILCFRSNTWNIWQEDSRWARASILIFRVHEDQTG